MQLSAENWGSVYTPTQRGEGSVLLNFDLSGRGAEQRVGQTVKHRWKRLDRSEGF